MISQGYTPYCAALSPRHTVGVCEWDVCVCVWKRQPSTGEMATCAAADILRAHAQLHLHREDKEDAHCSETIRTDVAVHVDAATKTSRAVRRTNRPDVESFITPSRLTYQ